MYNWITFLCTETLLSQWWKWKVKVNSLSRVWLFVTPRADYSLLGSSILGIFPGNNRVGCHFLLQEIFPTQGLNPGLPHCGQTLYRLNHQGSQLYFNKIYLSKKKKKRTLIDLKEIKCLYKYSEIENTLPKRISSSCHLKNIQCWTDRTSLVAQTVKRLPAMRETQVWPLGQEDPLEKGMATHSCILAWRIP